MNPNYDEILKANSLRGNEIKKTPLIHSSTFSDLTKSEIYLKTEFRQKTGSFKIRGAYYKIKSLSDEEKKNGVVAASAGNHAQGVALASSLEKISCTIVMPKNASPAKVAATRGYDWVVPPKDYDHTANYALFETFNMSTVKPKNIGFVRGQMVQENDHCFSQDFFDSCPDNSTLEGFFQTEKYFKNVEDDIRADFTFKDDYLKPCKEYIDSIETPPIFLHIRQADNIGREQFHPILPISFFEDALKNWSDDIPCFVFTDDIDWCKSQEFFQWFL